MKIILNDISFQLLPEKAIYREDNNTLIIADLHLGKASHFGKNGIFVPPQAAEKDYSRLHKLLDKFSPASVLLLGDLFHSKHNMEWSWFCDFIEQYPDVDFTLVKGNHDVLEKHHYINTCLNIANEIIEDDNFVFSHKPLSDTPEGKINIAGHVHPGFLLQGKARQSLKLPCFYLRENLFLVPAFGALTGLYLMDEGKNTRIFVVANETVIAVD